MGERATNKEWLVCIDVTLWASALGDNAADWHSLLHLIDEVKPSDMQLLYRKELQELGYVSPDKYWVIASKISKKSTIGYATDGDATHRKTEPDLMAGVTEARQKQELGSQLAYIYHRSQTKPRFIFATKRITEPTIGLELQDGIHRLLHICGLSAGEIQKKIESLMPVLNQAKHYMFPRHIGKGKVASTFKAYDRNNEQPAKDLLREAFKKYDGEELPAPDLWVWDEKNGCHVKFMHSGNNQYHGYDEMDSRKIPIEVT